MYYRVSRGVSRSNTTGIIYVYQNDSLRYEVTQIGILIHINNDRGIAGETPRLHDNTFSPRTVSTNSSQVSTKLFTHDQNIYFRTYRKIRSCC